MGIQHRRVVFRRFESPIEFLGEPMILFKICSLENGKDNRTCVIFDETSDFTMVILRKSFSTASYVDEPEPFHFKQLFSMFKSFILSKLHR